MPSGRSWEYCGTVGPNWEGEVPKGITQVFRSPTNTGLVGPRIFMDDTAEDRKAIQELLKGVLMYPVAEYDGTMKSKDWTNIPKVDAPPQGETKTQWVFPERLAEDSSRCHFWSPMSSIAPGRKIESFGTLHSRAFTNWRGRRRPMRKLKDRSPRRHPPKYGAMDIEPPERSKRNSGRCRAFQGTSPWSFDVRR
ncbi:DUF1254 domain-containing protein (plasmid) [Ensifer adhaerens]|nr:DUF1254 domain-containing protein [Ensifer adhaerens]QHG74720.1 DUF1254 domain-containing protein [Ensifer adhaerens]